MSSNKTDRTRGILARQQKEKKTLCQFHKFLLEKNKNIEEPYFEICFPPPIFVYKVFNRHCQKLSYMISSLWLALNRLQLRSFFFLSFWNFALQHATCDQICGIIIRFFDLQANWGQKRMLAFRSRSKFILDFWLRNEDNLTARNSVHLPQRGSL